MKNIYKIFAGTVFALASMFFVQTAFAGWNGNVGGTDCSPAFGIMLYSGAGGTNNGCNGYTSSTTASVGSTVNVRIYFRNTGSNAATGTVASISHVKNGQNFTFTGSLTSSEGGFGPSSATLSIPTNSQLVFVGAKVWRRTGPGTSPSLTGTISTVTGLQNVSLGTVNPVTDCPSNDAFCYQGVIVASYEVEQTQGTAQCNDGIDNDGDGRTDYPNDPGCSSYDDNDEYNYTQQNYQCNDGIDNDGDGRTDYPNDPGCSSYQDNDEYNYTYQNQCRINSFYASPSTVSSGGYTTLYWSTSDCTNVNIDGVSYPVGGQGTFGPLYSGRTYYISAYGAYGSDTKNTYVGVTQNTTYQCNDGIDNDGDGRVDYPNDPGCSSYQDTDEYNYATTAPTVLTITPTNITRTTARLNGIGTNAAGGNLYFEWGTSSALGNRTVSQSTVSNGDVTFYETLTGLSTNTLYYYRAVVEKNGQVYRGDLKSFITLTQVITPPTPTPQPPVVVVEKPRGVDLGLGTNLVQLKFQDGITQFGTTVTGFGNTIGNVCVGNIANWTLYYKNISQNQLNNVILHIDLPKDVAYRSSSGGVYNEADNSLTFNLGTLNIDQEGFITISGEVLKSAAVRDLLVATSTLSFENPINGARETAVAYGLINTANCVQERSSLAGLALFGGGFWPNTLIGWLILILVILGLLWLIRSLLFPVVVGRKTKKGQYYEHMDVPTAPYHG